jgi:hypothetical protein
MSAIRRLLGRLGRFGRDQSGVVSFEFVLIAPLYLVLFLSTVEAGVLLTRGVIMERALDMSVRNLRLGIGGPMTHDQLKAQICANTVMIRDCMNVVRLELRPVSTVTFEPLNTPAVCVERDEEIQPVVEFRTGVENELMLVRICTVVDPIFPTTGLGLRLPKDASGGFRLIATSAFVNEPT